MIALRIMTIKTDPRRCNHIACRRSLVDCLAMVENHHDEHPVVECISPLGVRCTCLGTTWELRSARDQLRRSALPGFMPTLTRGRLWWYSEL